MSGADSGNLGSYVGVAALKPFINSDLVLGELLDFSIPGTQFTGRGMTTEHFELICRGYVQALYEKAPLTDRQREIAIKCAVLTAGLTRPARGFFVSCQLPGLDSGAGNATLPLATHGMPQGHG